MIWSIFLTQRSMLHDLFTIGINGKTSGGWILLLPTAPAMDITLDYVWGSLGNFTSQYCSLSSCNSDCLQSIDNNYLWRNWDMSFLIHCGKVVLMFLQCFCWLNGDIIKWKPLWFCKFSTMDNELIGDCWLQASKSSRVVLLSL